MLNWLKTSRNALNCIAPEHHVYSDNRHATLSQMYHIVYVYDTETLLHKPWILLYVRVIQKKKKRPLIEIKLIKVILLSFDLVNRPFFPKEKSYVRQVMLFLINSGDELKKSSIRFRKVHWWTSARTGSKKNPTTHTPIKMNMFYICFFSALFVFVQGMFLPVPHKIFYFNEFLSFCVS